MPELAVPVILAIVLAIACVTARMPDRSVEVTIVLLSVALALLVAAAYIRYGDGLITDQAYAAALDRRAKSLKRYEIARDRARSSSGP